MELKTKVSSVVKTIVSDFKEKKVEMDKGFYFSQYETVRRINLYLNDTYLDRGDDAIFWNISTPRIVHFAKNIDLDTKDLMPYGEGEVSIFVSYCLKIKLQRWLEENHFAITLNDLSEGTATYGSAVWKKYEVGGKTELEEVDLSNLYFDPRVKYIKDASVVELHYMTNTDMKDYDGAWDNVDEAIKVAEKTSSNGTKNDKDIMKSNEVWEFTGQVEMENGSYKMKHYIGAGYGDKEIIMFEEDLKLKDFPYFDYHIGRYRGRWLRMGVVERLFRLQERANTIVNENAQATSIASLLLMRTNDPNTNGNVLEGAINGQIINSADLQQIGIDNRAFNILLNELSTIERQADLLCMTPEVIMGEASPSGTPFRSLAVTNNAAKSSFRYIKERIGETIGYVLKEEILPAIVREWNKGGILEILEDSGDVEMYDNWLKEKMMLKELKDGTPYSPELEQAIQLEIDRDIKFVGRRIELGKKMFDLKKFKIKFNVTGESVDKAQQNDAYFNAITMVMQNPAILDIPLMKQYLENNGISWWKLTPRQRQDLEQVAQQQGGQQGGQAITAPSQDKLMGQVDTTQ